MVLGGGRRGRLPDRHRPGGPLLHQPGRGRAVSSRCSRWSRPARPSAPSRAARCRPLPAAAGDWWRLHRRVVAALGTGTDVPAPAYVLPFALAGSVMFGTPAPWSPALMLLAVPVAALGRVAAAAGRRPAGRPARPAALAGGLGGAHLCPGPGHLRRLGRGPLRHGRRRGPAAVGRARRPRVRRPRPRPALARRLAHRRCCSPSVRPSCPASGCSRCWPPPWCWAPPPSSPPGCCASATAGARPSWRVAATPVLLAPWLLPLLTTGSASGLLLEAGRLTVDQVPSSACSPGGSTTSERRGGSGLVLGVLALVALVPRSTRDPGRHLLAGRAGRGLASGVLSHLTLDLPVGHHPAQPRPVRRDPPGHGGRRGRAGRRRLPAPPGRPPPLVAARRWRPSSPSSPPRARSVAWAGGSPRPTTPWRATPSRPCPPTWSRARCSGRSTASWCWAARWRTASPTGSAATTAPPLGEDEILTLADEDPGLTDEVRALVSSPTPGVVAALGARGIEYVVLTSPADGQRLLPPRRHGGARPGQRRGPQHARLARRPTARPLGPRRRPVVVAHRAAGRAGPRDPRGPRPGRADGPAATEERADG